MNSDLSPCSLPPQRGRTAVGVGLLLSLLALASVAVLPLLHDALHHAESESDCSGWECPTYVLQSGLALVLIASGTLRVLPSPARCSPCRPSRSIHVDHPQCRFLAPRAPPVSLI